MYFVYILKCSDNTLYTGITTDIARRVRQHNWEILGGAKYTASRRPVKLVYQEEHNDRSDATKREYAIQKFSRIKKLSLIENASS